MLVEASLYYRHWRDVVILEVEFLLTGCQKRQQYGGKETEMVLWCLHFNVQNFSV